ncbi:MAG: 8-amino-7-oxononanoate synthase [Desulfuromonadaceae bacterium]|nr:8-amino-7-oxononanoate synthase [Desulfuromonadaceae bacterium]MDD2849703.1 8-amino-7-oxononanoate synthase [Desulfuromonadaceae bacterium]MDD4129806.1 8-amino-7-oxononanoate synthase [Desulfuromonadaceae bacterium]
MQRTIQSELEEITRQGLLRRTRLVSGRQTERVTCNGRDVLLLCSNNYLGLADHPALAAASIAAIQQYGTSSGASRLVSGTMELHEQLENAVSDFKKCEAALVFNSGHAANTGIIPALVGRGDVVFSDRLNHASIVDGILLSGARLVRYRHNDYRQLGMLMEKHAKGRCLIVSDGVFSMDGDIAPLAELVILKRKHGALLMVDDAHGSGVLGSQGRGSVEMLGVGSDVDVQMGTFGKALGSFGAYAAVSAEMRSLLINRARSFIFSTSLPPSVLAASLAAVELVQSPEGDLLREQLSANTRFFRDSLAEAGFAIPDGSTQIVPVVIGSADTTMKFSEELLAEGLFAQGIRPPTVPVGTSRLRFTLMATHTHADLAGAVERITLVGRRLGVV